jgi:hypothetical protein
MTAEGAPFVEVAVPLPLPQTFTYAVPPALRPWIRPGQRVRVRVGRRRVTGVVWDTPPVAPEGIELLEPRDAARLEPVADSRASSSWPASSRSTTSRPRRGGERNAAADLPPWGDRRLALTLSAEPCAEPRMRSIVRCTTASPRGRQTATERASWLRRSATVDAARRGSSAGSSRAGWSTMAPKGGEVAMRPPCTLAPGDHGDTAPRARRRSPAGRAVVELLVALGRPATRDEIAADDRGRARACCDGSSASTSCAAFAKSSASSSIVISWTRRELEPGSSRSPRARSKQWRWPRCSARWQAGEYRPHPAARGHGLREDRDLSAGCRRSARAGTLGDA